MAVNCSVEALSYKYHFCERAPLTAFKSRGKERNRTQIKTIGNLPCGPNPNVPRLDFTLMIGCNKADAVVRRHEGRTRKW